MNFEEPKVAFPYKPPTEAIQKEFKHLFELQKTISVPRVKRTFDIVASLLFITITFPFIVAIVVSYKIEGLIDRESRGPVFFFYWGISHGRRMKKIKIRLVKQKFLQNEYALKNDWRGFVSEWSEESRTWTGSIVKKFYLDELPQFYSVLLGDMSIVGPRPLSEIHYKRDLDQGNVTRKLLRGGLLGLGHIRKGTDEMGDPRFEYEYADAVLTRSSLGLMKLDLWIIYKGFMLILKGGGH